ncbi:MAG: polysaccharide deacetylase family protein [Microcystaceae cyanobacterium]
MLLLGAGIGSAIAGGTIATVRTNPAWLASVLPKTETTAPPSTELTVPSQQGDPFLYQSVSSLEKLCQNLKNNPPTPTEAVATSPTLPVAVKTTSETQAAPPIPNCDNFWTSGLIEIQPPSIVTKSSNQLADLLSFFKPKEAEPVAPPVAAITTINLPEATASPNINPQARLSAVPILMYHDIVAKKEVSWDVTPEELEAHFQRIQSLGMTPITADQLLAHLRTGIPLPNKPVLISFDDGYGGHYQYVLPLLKKYNYPALFSIYITKMDGKTARTSVTWDQLKEMAASPLVTIAAHSVTHPKDLRPLTDDQLNQELIQSKQILQKQLGIPINYFTYPEGKYDARVKQWAIAAGYKMAFSMDDLDEGYAGDSPDLFSIKRFGQSSLEKAVADTYGGYPVPLADGKFNFTTPVQKRQFKINNQDIVLVSGGKPRTIHADSRYQVTEILKDTGAIGGVDGTFFSLETLTSNKLIGPALSSNAGFNPGNASENTLLAGRPLALISPTSVRFIPFDPKLHGSLSGIQKESQDGRWISDAFVAGAWLVRDGKPSTPESFGKLYGFDANRNRAFWGINRAGQPVVGATNSMIDSVTLGQMLAKLGFRDAIMVDSGQSSAVVFEGKSAINFDSRPVPHAIALYPANFPEPPAPILNQSVALEK